MRRGILVLIVILVALVIMQRRSGERPAGVAVGDSKPPVPMRSWPAASARTRQLVTTLSQVDLRPGALTPAEANAWRRDLAALQDRGTEAVPAIAEFLQKNSDVRFDSGPGPNLLGVPTLRLALMKVLFDIPTPDNVDLQLQVIAVTNDPDEVVLLARQLEMQEPRKHQLAVIDAARRSLEHARRGEFPGRDTSALAELLRRYEAAVWK